MFSVRVSTILVVDLQLGSFDTMSNGFVFRDHLFGV
jgi:hypothetical protein